jgi:BMFP domain-containing protein YqiC
MQTKNPLFDDLARVATGALGALGGVRNEIEERLREQLERILARMDLVSREEFEAAKAMASKAREEQEGLSEKLARVEARLAELEGRQQPTLAVSRPAVTPGGSS